MSEYIVNLSGDWSEKLTEIVRCKAGGRMSEYIVDGAEPNSTVLKSTTPNGYEHEKWLPVREEIVRCRNCAKFSEQEPGGEIGICNLGLEDTGLVSIVEPNGFCAWPERRTE